MCGPAVATPSVQKALKAALVQRGGQGAPGLRAFGVGRGARILEGVFKGKPKGTYTFWGVSPT